jgi:hypothetical protein
MIDLTIFSVQFELSDSLRLFSFPGLSSAGQLSGEPLCPFAECVLGDFSICTEDENFYKPLCRSPCATVRNQFHIL